jgi:hypothetical protein
MLTPLDLQLPPPGHVFQPRPAPVRAGRVGHSPHRQAPELQLEQMFLHVRVAAADLSGRLLQYAVVDAVGQVRLSLFAQLPTDPRYPVPPLEPLGPARLTPSISTPRALEAALGVCEGCAVLTFVRAPQGALLPRSVMAGAKSLDCARTRFLKVARQRGLRVQESELTSVNDALRLTGLPPVRSPDAALRALGLRQLSLWMDGTA